MSAVPPAPSAPAQHSPAVRSAVRKVFRRVVPLFFLMFVANYIDRVNLSFAKEQLDASFGISAASYGLGAGLFFVSYAIFEVPSNMLMQRFGAKVWLTRIMVTWGLVAAAMSLTDSATTFYVLRFLLGAAEAGFFPAVIYYFATWLPDSDRGRATSYFLAGSAAATVIAGPFSGALLTLDGMAGWPGWRWMFLVEGLVSIVLGLAAAIFIDSSIDKAVWLTAEEKTALSTAIADEQHERERLRPSTHISRWRLLADPRIVLFCWLFFAANVAIYAVTFWLPSIVKHIGHPSSLQVGWLSAIPWAASIVAMYVVGRITDRSGRRALWLVLALVFGSLGTYLATLGSASFELVALCVAAMGFKTAASVFWTIPPNYVDGKAAAPAIALVNSIGNLGGFVAPFTFGLLQTHTGSTSGGLLGLSVVGLLGAATVPLLRDRQGPRSTEAATATTH